MAVTTVATASQVQKFRSEFFSEYVRENLFSPYMGTTENSIIQVVEDLSKGAGKTVNVPLVTRLQNAGISGDNTLEGNEESLGNYNHAINIEQVRNAVRVGAMEQKHTEMDLLDAARTMLKLWMMEDLRDDIIQAMKSANVDGVTDYASCTEAQKDAWLAANYVSATNTRALFGAVTTNSSTEDHSTSLGNVDSTTDKLLFATVQLAKRLAKKADPHIRPVTTKKGREHYVMFAESYSFRDLKTDVSDELQNAQVRGEDNPLWQDPDLLLDGVIVREVPEIAAIAGVGNGGIDVAPNFFCGAQALGLAWGKRAFFRTETFDYGNSDGVAVGDVHGVEKLTYNNIQHGMVTVYTSGVADS